MKKDAPTLEDLFAVVSAATFGQADARVTIPEDPQVEDAPTRLGVALNCLLDDLAARAQARQQMADRLRILAEASREFSAATEDLRHLLQLVARRLGEAVGDLCVIRTLSDDGEWLESGGAAYHADAELVAVTHEVALAGRQRVGERVRQVISTARPVLVPKTDSATFATTTDPSYASFLERFHVASALTVPLMCRGKVVGIATLLRIGAGRPYEEADVGFVQSLADHAALSIANARSYAAERDARAAAEKATARFARLSEAGVIGTVVTDLADRRVLDINDTLLQSVGYSRDELVSGRVAWASLSPPEWQDVDALAIEQLTTSGIAGLREKEFIRKDGTRVPVLAGSAMLGGGTTECISFVLDLTARKTLEEQLRQSQKMEAVGRLAGGVAHDFNNVLSVILSFGEMLLGDMKVGDRMREDVEEIQKAASRASDLTRQLLMFSRQQVLQPRVLDLNEVLASMDKMLQRILGADVDLVSLPSKALGRVRIDPSSVEQVIMNLVVNARDAMPRGGQLTMETADVHLDEAYARGHLGVTPGAHVMLAVSDTGTGMDRATLARIFEPFFTTKGSGKGTGLGLSTVFGIVQQSGGSVWVYSEPGKGSTFKVYLPRVDASVEPARPAPSTTVRGTETILLVEDDDQVRAAARSILVKSGYHVLDASRGAEAILLSEKHPSQIHLLLSDVVMPQMSGPELAKRLAASRPDMKVLCMSGYTDDSIVRHGVLDAQLAFLQKPITPGALRTRVREVLDTPA